jgi:hypothetical protein
MWSCQGNAAGARRTIARDELSAISVIVAGIRSPTARTLYAIAAINPCQWWQANYQGRSTSRASS